MSQLENLWVDKQLDTSSPVYDPQFNYELRVDWSNDRHQAIRLRGLDPVSVQDALLEMAHLLRKELRSGYLHGARKKK